MSGYNDVNMLGSNSYSNSMSPSHSTSGGATEAIDLDSGGGASFLSGDPKHHDDLKEMLRLKDEKINQLSTKLDEEIKVRKNTEFDKEMISISF